MSSSSASTSSGSDGGADLRRRPGPWYWSNENVDVSNPDSSLIRRISSTSSSVMWPIGDHHQQQQLDHGLVLALRSGVHRNVGVQVLSRWFMRSERSSGRLGTSRRRETGSAAQAATQEVELVEQQVLGHHLLRRHVGDAGPARAARAACRRRATPTTTAGVCAATTLSSARPWISSSGRVSWWASGNRLFRAYGAASTDGSPR